MEGVSQEAIALAGHLRLSKLIVLFDDNGISIDGPLSLSDSVDQVKRFEAAGWRALRVDGHDPAAIARADHAGAEIRPADADRLQDDHRLRRAQEGRHLEGPWRAARRRGAGRRQGRARLERTAPSRCRTTILAAWAQGGARGPAPSGDAWRGAARGAAGGAARRVRAAPDAASAAGPSPTPIARAEGKLVAEPPTVATRKASEMALEVDHRGRCPSWSSAPPT